MVACLLTTQQRSGPKSKITQFLAVEPFPLAYELCLSSNKLSTFSLLNLQKFGGIRRIERISDEIECNLKYLETGWWERIMIIAEKTNRALKSSSKHDTYWD